MPHGLTPLGRQLRSVIAALGPPYHAPRHLTPLANARTRPTNGPGDILPRRDHAKTPARQYSAVAIAQQQEGEDVDEIASARKGRPTTPIDPSLRPASKGRLARRRRIDHLGEELRAAGRSDVTPPQYSRKKDISHYDPRSRHGVRVWKENQSRHAKDYVPDTEHSQAESLTRVLAQYIRRTSVSIEGLHSQWTTKYELGQWDQEILRSRGYDLDDLKVWADIVTEPDHFQAITALVARSVSHGMQAVPLPIFSYLLRRPSLNPRALRLLIEHAWDLFDDLESNGRHPLNPNEVFVIFLRLARFAGQLWPQALQSTTELLTRFMPDVQRADSVVTLRAVGLTSFLLNKAMFLVAQPTAQSPFKDNPHQEAAIVNVLSYMANHDPPLQIDRSGYRAVIRIQLAQQKTDTDRLWAELKALSWPPWKEDRTRMDSEVDLEYGISKAGDSLRRMAEAGYAPEPWERVAQIYAGWDTDHTPTIQTRTILFSRIPTKQSDAAVWAARISTTRTVQEAWACYLACEDAKQSFAQTVLLAIAKKLAQEGRRLSREEKKAGKSTVPNNERLLPGDAREIEPLPPSTHLYTYTRTSPPTLHEFFHQLDAQKVELLDHTLAFRIANSENFSAGSKHLYNASTRYPGIEYLLKPGKTADLSQIPTAVSEAYLTLLVKTLGDLPGRARSTSSLCPLLTGGMKLSANILSQRHSLVHAVSLLQTMKPRRLPAWNEVLRGLGNVTHQTKSLLINANNTPECREAVQSLKHEFNVIVAYRLTCHTLDLFASTHMDLDRDGFLALCHSTENVAIASWRALNFHAPPDSTDPPLATLEARELLRRQEPQRRLQHHFNVLIGSATESRGLTLPRLLTNPGPAILHAYIRALGWCGAHEELLRLTRWMVEHRAELEEARLKDRMGKGIMRRALVALRVFLERSWLDAEAGEASADAGDVVEQAQGDEGGLALSGLRRRAPSVVVKEIREIVDSVEEWGGWPDDESVDVYIRNQRFEEVK